MQWAMNGSTIVFLNGEKFSKEYLLDSIELNVKTRMTFHFADPSFKGFTPYPETATLPLENVCDSRRRYFPEGLTLGADFADAYLKYRTQVSQIEGSCQWSKRNHLSFIILPN